MRSKSLDLAKDAQRWIHSLLRNSRERVNDVMSSEPIVVMCPKCGTKNRVPGSRWADRPRCGKCKEPLDLPSLYPDRAIEVTDATFQREVASFRGPVLVDFTALW